MIIIISQAQPSNGKFVVRSGSTITLECRAQGNPMPKVAWTRQVSIMMIMMMRIVTMLRMVMITPMMIISELNDAVGGEEQSRELCGCRTGLSISVIMIFDDSTIGQK